LSSLLEIRIGDIFPRLEPWAGQASHVPSWPWLMT